MLKEMIYMKIYDILPLIILFVYYSVAEMRSEQAAFVPLQTWHLIFCLYTINTHIFYNSSLGSTKTQYNMSSINITSPI